MNELKLIRKVKKGNVEAFEQLIINYESNIYNIALGVCKNEHDAFDIAQEVLIKVYKNINKFNFSSKFSTWLYTVTRNTAIDYIRKEKNKSYKNISQDEEKVIEIADESRGPLDILIANEDTKMVKRCMEKLEETERLLIVFREIQGHSYEELAAIFDIKIGTVKSRLSRAKTKLKNLIVEDMEQNAKKSV